MMGSCRLLGVIILLAVPASTCGFSLLNHASTYRDRRGFRFRSLARFSTENNDATTAAKPQSENIDLFAAGDRKSPIKAKSSTVSSSVTTSTEDKKFSAASSTLMGRQAELLRLEAEKDMMAFDYERINQQMTLLKSVDACLLRLLEGRTTPAQVVANERSLLCKELFLRLVELANAEPTQAEKSRLTQLYDTLLEEVGKADSALLTDITSDIQKELKLENSRVQQSVSNAAKASGEVASNDEVYDEMLKQWMSQIGSGNSSNTTTVSGGMLANGLSVEDLNRMMMNGSSTIGLNDALSGRSMLRLPAAMPFNMIPLLLSTKEIDQNDLDIVKNLVFTSDILNNTVVDGSAYLTAIRGKPIISVADTFNQASERIAALPGGVSDRVRLFLLPEYRLMPDAPITAIEKYSGSQYEPIFVLVSKDAVPKSAGIDSVGNLLALVATAATCFVYATDVNSLNADFMTRALAGDVSTVDAVLPIFGGLLAVQIAHDVGHYLMGLRYQTKLSFPSTYWPSLQIGLFGSVTRFLSFPKTRKELFDVSIAGPVLGFAASLWCTLQGVSLTAAASAAELSSYPQLPNSFFRFSFLINEVVDSFLHIAANTDPAALTPVHPLLAVGAAGLLTNALNFLPLGRLDGGRVAMAVAGRQSAASITTATLIGQAVSLLSVSSPLTLYWLIAVVILQRGADLPPEDDVTPVATAEDDANKPIAWFLRLAALAFCITLTAGILLPVPMDVDLSQIQAPVTSVSQLIQGVPNLPFEPPNII
ncbi:hypothetical protein B484DRAFT_392215 [Ochromonadaceae sp. CCMP2298]|nr:hypothetical protein B484DRAFT_392215 [Ochromonadaceae sp. CCMP2298]